MNTVRDLAARVAPPTLQPGTPGAQTAEAPRGPAFADLLARASAPPRLTMTAHAGLRVQERGIDASESVLHRIAEAIDTLDAKGSKDALLMSADAAFIVNVPNRTVVTALDTAEMRDRVFTQIDAAMLF